MKRYAAPRRKVAIASTAADRKRSLISRLIRGVVWFLGLGLASMIAGLFALLTSNLGKQIDRRVQQCALAGQIVTADRLNQGIPVPMSHKLVEDAAGRADQCIREGTS